MNVSQRLSQPPCLGRRRSDQTTCSLNPVVYHTPMVHQPDDLSCWAATIAMVASGSLNDGSFYTVDQVIDFADEDGGGRFRGPVRWADIKVAMERWGLRELAPASWPPKGWANLLNNYGPLGVVLRPDGNPDGLFHAVVLCGISGGGDPENTITTVMIPGGHGGDVRCPSSTSLRSGASEPPPTP